MADNQLRPHADVVGGGLSGLTAAKRLADAGYKVDVFEGGDRVGGKIRLVTNQQGFAADTAAEFIDSDHGRLADICKELNIPVIKSLDSLESTYALADGRILSDAQFNATYRPISRQVIRDKKIIAGDPSGARARHLDSTSTSQYLRDLADNVKDERSFFLRLFTAKPAFDPYILRAAEQGYSAESGRPADQISGLQFLHEAAGTQDTLLLHSDCAFRVEGGTQRLTDALRADLEAKGATFHFNSKTDEISKQDGKFRLGFENGNATPASFDQVVLGVQAHDMANIRGLEAVGLGAADQDALRQLQYSHSTKITVKTKAPVPADGFLMSSEGYQSWGRGTGEVVFLIGDDLPNRYKPQELMSRVLNDYAAKHGTTADRLFDASQFAYNGPNVQKPCYASPSQGQALKLQRLSDTFDYMAEQGVGVAGTYVPRHTADNRACGFMFQGVESADRAADILVSQYQQQAQSSVKGPFALREVQRTQNRTQGGLVMKT